ncbi:dephospho-CoA kinase [Mangrovicoccus algicola]|uniref:Dephospho-CoA kinase n=1 Tax=Mangrovicoccus algicola TaxID=2771008 RepID=A0A8J6YS12_9RHOB|nr:dephospho-CoA kinase [Mangrovicoccus algicola]MBE3638268.1 dephospho-CoA kinase [Mangrovicoccus algicola]
MSRPVRLGLTGSIGMGKSTTARMFVFEGCELWDADAAVHRLYAPGGAAVAGIAALHPAAVRDGAVSRAALKAWIAADAGALSRIEALVHPLVAADRAGVVSQSRARIVVCDIPLLFENGTEAEMDAVAVVSAPAEVQRARVLGRPGMTEADFEMILARQMPDAEKRRRADYLIETVDMETARRQVRAVIADLEANHA